MHVLLINEGTYPFHWGGVSTWCHLHIRDLPDVEFTLLSIVANPRAESRFTLPSNVIEFRPVPLWGIIETREVRPDLTLMALSKHQRQTSDTLVSSEFVPLFREFLHELYTSDIQPEHMGTLCWQMYQFFQRHDFDTTMRSQAIWECFAAAAQDDFPETAARHGYPDAAFDLGDLTQGLQQLYHWIFPLASPLPKADIAHASMAGICSMIGVVAKLEYGIPFMLTEHGVYLRERYLAEAAIPTSLFLKLLSLRFARRMTALAYAMADQISPCCDYNQRWEFRNGASIERLKTIYYGADSGQFSPEYKPVGEPPVVVWVGRINPLKDLITLLKAAAIVKETRPDIEFRLFGSAAPEDAQYYAECLELRTKLDLSDTVTFAGYASNTATAYNQGDIVVLCSISEGFPFAILEAMLCGKPIVATEVGGVPEQIEGCGIVVEPRNPHELATAITTLMNDPARCVELGHAAREIAAQEFTVRQSADAHRTSYGRLLSHSANLGKHTLIAEPTQIALQAFEHGNPVAIFENAAQVNDEVELEIEFGGSVNNIRQAPIEIQRPVAPDVSQQGTRRRARSVWSNEPSEWISPNSVAISELATELLKRDPHPIDYLEVAAVLESMGMTDQLAALHYGAPDTFILAEEVLKQLEGTRTPPPVHMPSNPLAPSWSNWQSLYEYAGGLIALVPSLALLVFINMYAKLGQWNSSQVLALSLGITAGMLFTNGFVQANMRRSSLALSFGSPRTAGRFLRLSLQLAAVVLVGIAAIVFLATSLAGWFTTVERLTFCIAFLGISMIWLLAGILSLLRTPAWLGLGLVVGILVGYCIDALLTPFSAMHLILGITVGFVSTIGIISYRVLKSLGRPSKSDRVFLPSTSYMLHEALPYFTYGSVYMLLIFVPHALGWFGILGPGQSWNDAITSIEAGLTLSIPPLALASGFAERTLRLFWNRALVAQKEIPGQNPALFGRTLLRFYWQQLGRYLIVLALISIGTAILFQIGSATLLSRWITLPSFTTLTLVFYAGLVAYCLLGWSWFNCMFSLTLGRPQIARKAVLVGLAVMLAIGLPLSLGVHFIFAALAFVVGAIAFVAASSRYTYQLLKSADYYYYSSC